MLLALALVASSPAYAQHDNREVDARELFALGKYAEALALYGKLYAEAPHPTYLRNIGRCYQNLGEPDKAIGSFREYLRQAKNLPPEQRTVVEGYIREMEDLKNKREAAAAAAAAPATPVAAQPPRARGPAPVSETPAPIVARPAAGGGNEGHPETTGVGSRRTVSYVIAGAGVAALGVGGFFGARAISREGDSEALCPGTPCGGQGLSLSQQAKTDARVADFTMGAGLVAVGVGAYLFFTSRPSGTKSNDGRAEALHFAPQVGPNQVGLLAGASW